MYQKVLVASFVYYIRYISRECATFATITDPLFLEFDRAVFQSDRH